MSETGFENIRETLLETQEFDYRPEDWQEVKGQLHPKKKRRFFWWFFFGLLLPIGFWAGIKMIDSSPPKNLISEVQQEKAKDNVEYQDIKSSTVEPIKEQPREEGSEQLLSQKQRSQTRGFLPLKNNPLVKELKLETPASTEIIEDRNESYPIETNHQVNYSSQETENENIKNAGGSQQLDSKAIFRSNFIPTLALFVKYSAKESIGIVRLKPQENENKEQEKIDPVKKTIARIGLGIGMPLGNSMVLEGNDRSPKAVGQSVQMLYYLNPKTLLGIDVKKQKSFSFNDSLEVVKVNAWYPDWSDGISVYYDSLDIEQNSLSLDLSVFRTLVNTKKFVLHAGLSGRFTLNREHRIFSTANNPYGGNAGGFNKVKFTEVLKGVVPEIMIDVPLNKGLGLSFGAELLIPTKKVKLDIEPKASVFGRLYFKF
jgi:hypothetical protein